MKTHEPIPRSHPVQPLKRGHKATLNRATCGHCGLSWDDGKVTSMTPAPAGRCPFEAFHVYPEDGARHKPDLPYVMSIPQNRVAELIDPYTDVERQRVDTELRELIQNAAWRSGYVAARCSIGGDQGHERAVKDAERLVKRVRKVLGYSYP